MTNNFILDDRWCQVSDSLASVALHKYQPSCASRLLSHYYLIISGSIYFGVEQNFDTSRCELTISFRISCRIFVTCFAGSFIFSFTKTDWISFSVSTVQIKWKCGVEVWVSFYFLFILLTHFQLSRAIIHSYSIQLRKERNNNNS